MPRLKRFGKFNLVGLLGAASQLVLLSVLTRWFHLPVIAATPLTVEIVILHNFLWHERFTWRDRRLLTNLRERTIRLWRFHAGNGFISLLGNTALTYYLVQRLKFPVLPSAAGAILVCSVVNFFVADQWVYASRAINFSASIAPKRCARGNDEVRENTRFKDRNLRPFRLD